MKTVNYCAQSVHNNANCDLHDFIALSRYYGRLPTKWTKQEVNLYSTMTSGQAMEGEDLNLTLKSYSDLNECYPNMIFCASFGLMSLENINHLKETGLSMYHTNIETSNRYFSKICTSHTYEDKINQIKIAKETSLEVCYGAFLACVKHGMTELICHFCCQVLKFLQYL